MEIDIDRIAISAGLTARDVELLIRQAKFSMIPHGKQIDVIESGLTRWLIVTRLGIGTLETEYGEFHQFDFVIDDTWGKYSVLFFGKLDDDLMPLFKESEVLLMRIDSGCETGQLFHDQTCECQPQLLLAMETVAQRGEGLIVNIPRQDGRGLGLPFKLATLRLQKFLKLDTVEAANLIAPNGVIDIRTYGGVIGILKFFGIQNDKKIALATNNPKKSVAFTENGYALSDLVPIVIPPTARTLAHLDAKQNKLGHIKLVHQPEKDETVNEIAQEPGSTSQRDGDE